MKSDREFLDGMWDIVSQTEYEETQKAAARSRHHRMMRRNVVLYLSLFAVFAVLLAAFQSGRFSMPSDYVYLTAGISLAFALWVEISVLDSGEIRGGMKRYGSGH